MIVIDNTCFLLFSFAVLGVPIWTFLSKKPINVHLEIFINIVIYNISICFFLESGDFFFIIISCLTGLCLSADMLIPLSIQADIVDLHKMKFKEDMSGVIFSIVTFLNKFSFALASIFFLVFWDF